MCPGPGQGGGAGGATALGALVYYRDGGALTLTLREGGGVQYGRSLNDRVLALTAPYTEQTVIVKDLCLYKSSPRLLQYSVKQPPDFSLFKADRRTIHFDWLP